MSLKRDPYRPTADEWPEVFNMLCGHCAHFGECQIVEGMIEMKDGGQWPDGGWTTDPGAGVTCLSYQTRPMKRLSRQQLRQAIRQAVPMCSGCAAQKGSEASVSLHTRRDFSTAVKSRALFVCHAEGQKGKPCGGWCQAVQRGTA
jgi:hypothetical protein